jgi:excisionase family DNA binding protein
MAEPLVDALKEILREIIREEIARALSERRPEPLELTGKEASALLNLPESWVMAAARRGELRAIHHGHHVRFRKLDLEQFIEESTCIRNSGDASGAAPKRRDRKSSAAEPADGAADRSAGGAVQSTITTRK